MCEICRQKSFLKAKQPLKSIQNKRFPYKDGHFMPFQDVIPICNCLLYMFYMCFTIVFYETTFRRVSLLGCQRSEKNGANGGEVRQAPNSWVPYGGESCLTNKKCPSLPITDPWDDCIFTYMKGCFLMVNVGIYTSPMDPMGWLNKRKTVFFWVLSLKQPSHHLIPHYPTGN